MKNLKDCILEAKLQKQRDPFYSVSKAFEQVVTHYSGYGNAGKYTSAPSGKSGLDGDQLEYLLECLSKISDDCSINKYRSEDIFDKIKDNENVYIHVYKYDKHDNGGKGFIGIQIYGKSFEINLTEGYAIAKKYNTHKYNLSSHQSFIIDSGDFLELLESVEWPKDHFTNVSDWEEFEKGLEFIFDSLQS